LLDALRPSDFDDSGFVEAGMDVVDELPGGSVEVSRSVFPVENCLGPA
jgi:hypothetical protein